jgi:hypothetical protein
MLAMKANPFLGQDDIPFCFDTSAIYGDVAGPRLLKGVRDRFPNRELMIPAWVVAEKLRQMKRARGERLDMVRVRGFLADPDLKLRIMPFGRETATGSWLEVVGNFTDEQWRWEHLPKQYTQRPCAQRCRSGDHIVYATARTHGALLVTEDDGLIKQVQEDGYEPGAIAIQALQSLLDDQTT